MIKQAYEHFGRIDILVNNAGRGYDVPVEKTDIDIFHYLFDLDVVRPTGCHERSYSAYATTRWRNNR